MPIVTEKEMQLLRAVAISKREHHDPASLTLLLVECVDELEELHNHAVDRGVLDCDGIPGGCPSCVMIRKVNGT